MAMMSLYSPLVAKSGVRMKSVIRVMLVILDAAVEHTVIQKACPYVKPSLKRCCTPKTVTVMILMTSVHKGRSQPEGEDEGTHHG